MPAAIYRYGPPRNVDLLIFHFMEAERERRWQGYMADMAYLAVRALLQGRGEELPTYEARPAPPDARTAGEIKRHVLQRLRGAEKSKGGGTP